MRAQDTAVVIQPRGDASLSGTMPGTGPAEAPRTLWTYDLDGAVSMGMALQDETLYLTTKSPGQLIATDTSTGEERWSHQADGDTVFGPSLAGDLVVIGVWGSESGLVVALDRESGEEAWRVEVPNFPKAPTYADGVLYVPAEGGLSAENAVQALDAETGEEIWTFAVPDSSSIGDAVAVADGIVVVSGYTASGSGGAGIYALDAASGEEKWRFSGSNALTFDPVVGDGVVLAIDLPRVWGLDLATGEEIWQISGADSGGGAAITGGTAVVAFLDEVRALDVASGDEVWSTPIDGVGGPPVVAGDLVYVAAWRRADDLGADWLYALDLASGDERWSQQAEFKVSGNQPIANDGVLYLDGSGVLAALGSAPGSGGDESPSRLTELAGGSYESAEFGYSVEWLWPWAIDEAASGTEDGRDTLALSTGSARVVLTTATLDMGATDFLDALIDSREQGTDSFEVVDESTDEGMVIATLQYEADGETWIEYVEVSQREDVTGLRMVTLVAPADATAAAFASAQDAIAVDEDPPFSGEPAER
jgi:outer membrane protein assembly factor BamB